MEILASAFTLLSIACLFRWWHLEARPRVTNNATYYAMIDEERRAIHAALWLALIAALLWLDVSIKNGWISQ